MVGSTGNGKRPTAKDSCHLDLAHGHHGCNNRSASGLSSSSTENRATSRQDSCATTENTEGNA